MTTITIKEDLPLENKAFGSVAELFEVLEEQNLFVVLHELGQEEVTEEESKMAEQTRKEYLADASAFTDL